MINKKSKLILLLINLLFLFLIVLVKESINNNSNTIKNKNEILFSPLNQEKEIKSFIFTNTSPKHLTYDQITEKIFQWQKESNNKIEILNYGKSSKNKDLYCLHWKNENKNKCLLTACIHGNEPWSTGLLLAYFGNLLDNVNNINSIEYKILSEIDLYVIFVISPDSYPNNRYVDGVDPNRNFPYVNGENPNIRSPIIQHLINLQNKYHFNSMISMHTYGRMYLHPWGYSMSLAPDNENFKFLIGQMGNKSNYKVIPACKIYNKTIFGGELDWFYNEGVYAIVMEVGTHQRIPTIDEIKNEFKRTKESLDLFILNATYTNLEIKKYKLNLFN